MLDGIHILIVCKESSGNVEIDWHFENCWSICSDDAQINVAFCTMLEHGSDDAKVNVACCNVLEHGSDDAKINVACCNVLDHGSDDVNRQSIRENDSKGICMDDVHRQ